jgi:uncharacterized protein GlcG (DUF336 family)
MRNESIDTISIPFISRATAAALVKAAIGVAQTAGAAVAVAVTDGSGHLVAFERMDAARFLAVEVAVDKAWAAASSGFATHQWNELLTHEPKVAPLGTRPRLVGVGGGYPVIANGQIMGAIGVSGGSSLQDQTVAAEALNSMGFTVQP